jgi:hypothetical protein
MHNAGIGATLLFGAVPAFVLFFISPGSQCRRFVY